MDDDTVFPVEDDSGDNQGLTESLSEVDILAELRGLLVDPGRCDLDEIRRWLSSPGVNAADLAAVLPEAIALRASRDDELGRALASTVERALRSSATTNPRAMVDAMVPAIGPALRKALGRAITSTAGSLNETVEHRLSLRSFRWRLEAARTRKPFAEVVMLHTLRFRVEQVFLIHAASGLLIRHVAASGVVPRDRESVSNMSTAIADFVRDSVASPRDTEARDVLPTMRLGGVTVWIESGPHAVLAGAVRGSAPAELRRTFREVLEDLHRRHGGLLESFQGDDTQTPAVEPAMRQCLVSAALPGEKRRVAAGLVIVGLLLLGLIGGAVATAARSNLRWGRYVDRLESTPGVMLVDADHNWWGRSSVRGLVGPEGVGLPAAILAAAGLDEKQVQQRWEAYPSAVATPIEPPPPPRMEAAGPTPIDAARELLEPPPSVTLDVRDDALVITGEASHWWIQQARQRLADLEKLTGLTVFKIDQLINADQQELQRITVQIAEASVAMPDGSALDLEPQREAYQHLVTDLAAARDSARRLDAELVLTLTGHSDSKGDPDYNRLLSEARAATVAEDLQNRFAPPINLVIRGVGSDQPIVPDTAPDEQQKQNRRVTFGVELRDAMP